MIIIVMVMAISTLLLTQVVLMNMTSLTLAEESTEGDVLFTRAEGYLENAAIRFVRNTNYNGEIVPLQDDDISCTIVVTPLGAGTADLVSSCSRNGRTKNAGMQATLAAGRFTFSKITER